MIYLDYSATTKTSDEVLDSFVKASREFVGNPNSLHKLGTASHNIIEASTEQLANLLGVKKSEIIYTSGASEANNAAIKGIALKYQNRGKHIITSHYEHPTVYGPLNYLQTLGFEVDFVDSDEFGRVSLEHLKSLMRDDTILVSIGAINSEIGIIQPVEEIGSYLKNNHPKCFFHVDITQAVGKTKINLKDIDRSEERRVGKECRL